LLAHVVDISKYRELTPELTTQLIDEACQSYFLQEGAA
jgi:hypothetical protein